MRTARSSSHPGGCLHQAPPGSRHPSGPGTPNPPGADTPQNQSPPREQNSWHTPMKILPCPKLRLRVVKIYGILLSKSTQMVQFDLLFYILVFFMYESGTSYDEVWKLVKYQWKTHMILSPDSKFI